MQDSAQLLYLQYNQKLHDLLKTVNLFGHTSNEAVKCSQELDQIVFEIQKKNMYACA